MLKNKKKYIIYLISYLLGLITTIIIKKFI